ncbi:MAG TPA: pyridoxal phosphate-dependent aminotransferase [Vicinamibacterales bacterium]|nr:pyridoxal phosphate-dependent aminotransferase [Vicinamibacterales bacterium]
MMFASRVPADLLPNCLSTAVATHRASRRPLLDLTVTNPTLTGIPYPPDILTPLADVRALQYTPEPFGGAAAREAVARDYARRGISVALQQVVLTASTSEAYSLLFKLLCDPAHDDVLVPVPSYPLFDHLTRLDGVGARPYVLEYHGRWQIDEQSVDTAWTSSIQAVLAVTPNNPTGSSLAAHEMAFLTDRCAERRAALILDEVFADYPLAPPDAARPHSGAHGTPDALTFRLGGLSKSAGLPQVKLGWIAVDGPPPLVDSALQRLELICDTYLSVSTPVQVAAPELIARGAAVRAAIQERIRMNHAHLRAAVASHPSVDLLHADGGWAAVVRIPASRAEEEVVLDLLERHDTLVHPGFFFDFPREAFLVLSLLPDPAVFREGVARILEHAGA